ARLRDSLVLEIGKTNDDADGEIGRCIQILEHCCSITTLQTGETLPDIAQDMNILTFRLPLGVTAGITPFNFPAMVPISIFSMSTVCGNTCVIKPSSCDPGAVMILMELCLEAGFPPGVVNVIHGRKEPVTFVCDHPDVVALSFVGSDEAGSYVYERGAKNGKRVQSNLGAKNHAIVMPDANKERTLSSLISGSFGAAGQRCMALSTAIFVGDSKQWIPELVERSKTQKVTSGAAPGADFGPLISPEAKKRVCDLIQSGVDAGAELLLEGRNIQVKGYENGNFLGPTILHRVH
uniref:methylmalonate-semialdehyde dehydrogenase (CoA acylating) n=1 Tax=Biomphalaria glabrata TaxID=6526 RepID=A0A2C9K6K7_BIOGL